MQGTSRALISALAASVLLALVGCGTLPKPAGQQAAAADTAPTAAAAPAPAAADQVEFYVGQSQPGNGLSGLQVPGGMLYLSSTPVLTRDDLSEAAALVDKQGNNFVGLRFTETGARKLNEVSTRSVGKMLALVIGRDLVASPRITEPLNKGVLAFGVPSAQDAAAIAARIRGDKAQ
ncbi:MAG TPA: preprotein translocase subunit SecD [Bordetella sp.]